MTLSLLAHDPRTGGFGMVVASSSPAVAARCLHLRAGAGVAASQNVTNPALGPLILDLLARGVPATDALELAETADPAPEYRQLAAVDRAGRAAVRSGAKTLGTFAARVGDGVAAAGNLLANAGVVEEMLAGYVALAGGELEDRLLAGLRAGLAAGGEAGPLRSAGLAVVAEVSWPVTDLRVDDHDGPVAELARLWELWRGQKAGYLRRALDPAGAPAYGVPGDPR